MSDQPVKTLPHAACNDAPAGAESPPGRAALSDDAAAEAQQLLAKLEQSLQQVLKAPGEDAPSTAQAAAGMDRLLALLSSLPRPVPAELAQAVGQVARLHSQVVLALAQRRQELMEQIALNRAGRQGLAAYAQ